MVNDSIFVSIASYRDSELIPTVLDCLNKADNPKNITIGICWQRDNSEDISSILNSNVKAYECDWKESRGACWSRHIIQKNLYKDEDYYLQLDSHHRFDKSWDTQLKALLLLSKKNSNKSIIGSYATTYWPNESLKLDNFPYKIATFDSFTQDGDLISRPVAIKHTIIDELISARLLSGHFLFTDGFFVKECPYDPNYYFRGEELVLSVRAYTHGYDLYHPTKSIIWHEYLRPLKLKHWTDHTKQNGFIIESQDRDNLSKERQRKLLCMETNDDIDFRQYGLGSIRSLHDYELYAGIDFKKRRVHKYCYNVREDSPDPYIMTQDEWNSGMLQKYEIDMEWDLSKIPPHKDFDFWFVGFENKKGQLLWRNDFKAENKEHRKFLDKKINKTKFIFSSEQKPDRLVIAPHSISEGWTRKVIIEC